MRADERGAGQIRFEHPGLVENGAVQLRAGEPRLDQPRRAQIHMAEVEPGEIGAGSAVRGALRHFIPSRPPVVTSDSCSWLVRTSNKLQDHFGL